MRNELSSISQPAAMPDIYPMPSFVALAVRDVASSIAWYCDLFGFQLVMSFGVPGGAVTFAHLRWIKFADLLLRTGKPNPAEGVTIFYQIELDRIDPLAERARDAGVQLLSEPTNQPWNTRDFTIADSDGYRIAFTAGPVNKTLSMAGITARMSKG